ncbi:Immunoglobulin iota chain [Chelonia mydas]|nr:Immunoglobulin iota chain [Chelonia mydas]
MAWAPLLLTLLTYCSGSSSQPVLTQTPSVSVSPGENVRLACTMPSGYSIGSYRVGWYQQKSGSAPRFVYHYYTSSDQGRGTGIPARFTVSPDSSSNRWNLVIAGVQAEDDADYYCAVWDGRSNAHHSDTGRQRTETKTLHPACPPVPMCGPDHELPRDIVTDNRERDKLTNTERCL